MMVRVELFYSSTCPHCPRAKEILVEVLDGIDAEIRFDEVNVLSPEGIEKAKKHGILAVPAIVINSRHVIVGVPARDRLLKVITRETGNGR